MMGAKETKQLVLYCLSLQTSLFGEKKSAGYVGYSFLYNRLPLESSSIRNAVAQMARTGEINKIISNQKVLLGLSALGRKRLQEWAPALFPKSKPGTGFFMVLFLAKSVVRHSELPSRNEETRSLREKLARLGFVKLQRGVYCSWKAQAEEIEKIILKSGLSNHVLLIPFEETQLFRAHDLSYKLLKLRYYTWSCQKLINQLESLLKKVRQGKGAQIKVNQEVKLMIKESFVMLKKLPNLPKNLTPPSWSIANLKEKLKKVSDVLAD